MQPQSRPCPVVFVERSDRALYELALSVGGRVGYDGLEYEGDNGGVDADDLKVRHDKAVPRCAEPELLLYLQAPSPLDVPANTQGLAHEVGECGFFASDGLGCPGEVSEDIVGLFVELITELYEGNERGVEECGVEMVEVSGEWFVSEELRGLHRSNDDVVSSEVILCPLFGDDLERTANLLRGCTEFIRVSDVPSEL